MGKFDALSRIPAFANLPRAVLTQLAEMAGLQRIGKNSTIFREGERAHFVYAIVEGCVTLVSESVEGETVADFFNAGEIVLIAPVVLDLPYMATGRATTDVLALMIPAADFRRLANTELTFSAAINRVLSLHWRLLLKRLKQARTRDADTRVAHYLVDNMEISGAAAKLNLPGSKRQLAAHLGMTPETLSRAFRRLGELGVKTNGAEITIASVARLTDFAERSRDSAAAVPALETS